jgi:hypothetical protein
MRLFGAFAALTLLASMAGAQEIGLVTLKPNPGTGDLYAKIPVRPENEQVYIVRDGTAVASGRVKHTAGDAGTLISIAIDDAARIQVGDRISLSQTIERPLPDTAFRPLEPTSLDTPTPPPAPPARVEQRTTREVTVERQVIREHKEPRPVHEYVEEVRAVSPRLTPRDSAVVAYPRPAVVAVPEAGILGPYGPGLAAAAPVGTPYLRSPAFAGPPIIYMPQTVSRVLLPGLTPYPSNIMHPPAQYVYASAPFTRTDIYVDLPYGTFYWPQGYAGTAPVEPQVPAYVLAPSTAILTNEANYTVQRYDPLVAHPETINPVSPYEVQPVVPTPPPSAPIEVLPPGPAFMPGPPPLPPMEGAPLIPPPAPLFTPVPVEPAPDVTSPFTPGLAPEPATFSTAAEREGIVVDDSTPGGIVTEPAGAWQPSRNPMDSYLNSSLIAIADGRPKTATFKATVTEEADYEIFLWWVSSNREFRSAAVPVTVYTATGPVTISVDQTVGNRMFNSIGVYRLKVGEAQPVVSVSTEGVPAGPTINVSVDAMKLVKVTR